MRNEDRRLQPVRLGGEFVGFSPRVAHILSERRWLVVVGIGIMSILSLACAIKKVETSKVIYLHGRAAQEQGNDMQAAAYWTALRDQTSKEISSNQYLTTNYFLRASANFELGDWDAGFADLKQVDPENLSKEEFWIYPLFSILMGEYYSHQNMTSVADNFYQSVLRKSTFKSSPIYLLALERHVNNAIKAADLKAVSQESPEKYKLKQYEDLTKDLMKYVEEFPYMSVPHYLLGDLLLKSGRSDESLEQLLASLELDLPTSDLQRSAEFEIAQLLSSHDVSAPLKSVLLDKAFQWWKGKDNRSIFRSGENTLGWIRTQENRTPVAGSEQSDRKVRYLAVSTGDNKWKILVWEAL
jgi:tetratricopeptide (TPR) repeat protein